MPIAIADEEYTHFRNIVKLKTSAYGELDSIPKMCEEQLQRLQSANCTIIDKEFWGRGGKSCVKSIKTNLLGENYGRNNFYQGGFST